MRILKETAGPGQASVQVGETVAALLREVRERGDDAVLDLTARFDGVRLERLEVPERQVKGAYDRVSRETVESLEFAAAQLRDFAERQLGCLAPLDVETLPGVTLGHRLVPVRSVGAYVPAGRYPLPSTALHTLVPAAVAGVRERIACSPPAPGSGGVHPAVLVAFDLAGADRVFCMGGAQAVAAFAYGTDTVPAVDLVVGPGNAYVTEAKRQVVGAAGIDLLAGPSEVLIIADESADPRLVAVDLLANCEHEPGASAWLVTTSQALAEQVLAVLPAQAATLATGAMALQTWQDNGGIVVVESLEEAVTVSDERAPEHLQLMTVRDEELADRLHDYGSLFLGPYAPVAFGDYVSGTNHTLPTMRSARFANGLWVGTFLKAQSRQRVSAEGAARLAGHCARLAAVEGLAGHRRSAELRMG